MIILMWRIAVVLAFFAPFRAYAETAEELFASGVKCIDDAQWENAIGWFSRTIESNPRPEVLAPAYLDRGVCREHISDPDGAVHDYDSAIQVYPDYAAAYGKRAYFFAKREDYEHALADANKALSIVPSSVEAFYARALAKVGLKDYDGAAHDYTSALAFRPNDPEGYVGRAICRSKLGDQHGAVQDFTRAFALDPKNKALRERLDKELRNRPNQALQHNDPSCHAACVRTCRASRGRG